MSEFVKGAQFPQRHWEDTRRWLVHSLGRLDVGDIFEVGPATAMTHHTDDFVPCVQVQALEDGCRWLRRATSILGTPLLTDFSTGGLTIDVWLDDDFLDDGTQGHLFSFDHDLLAEAVVTWFRDRHRLHFDDLGCELHAADRLPRAR